MIHSCNVYPDRPPPTRYSPLPGGPEACSKSDMAGDFSFRAMVKALVDGACIAVAALPAGLCRLEARFGERGDLFTLFGQGFSIVPGLPGNFLRRAFARLTLDGCARDCEIGFLTWFSSRHARVGRGVYIGPMCVIADAAIGDGSLVATRVSILSGKNQHGFDAEGRLIPFSRDRAAFIGIGRNTWIGEGAVVMADVGDGCVVAAGAVVTRPVPSGQIVGGNPARVIGTVEASFGDEEKGRIMA